MQSHGLFPILFYLWQRLYFNLIQSRRLLCGIQNLILRLHVSYNLMRSYRLRYKIKGGKCTYATVSILCSHADCFFATHTGEDVSILCSLYGLLSDYSNGPSYTIAFQSCAVMRTATYNMFSFNLTQPS